MVIRSSTISSFTI